MKISQLFGYNADKQMSKELRTVVAIHILFMVATSMSNIFLNIFIWITTKNLESIISYNLFLVLTVPFIFILGNQLIRKKGVKTSLILGMIFYTLFYLIVLIFRNNIAPYIALIGILRGISSGFYYLAFHVFTYDFSNDKNRDYLFGLVATIGTSASMISPLIAGFIISYSSGIHGYEIIFIISLIAFIIGSVLSFSLPEQAITTKSQLRSVISLPFKNSNWARIMFSEAARGTRENVISFVPNILIFILVSKELSVGNFVFWTYLFAIISSYLFGIVINPKNRSKYLFVGTIITALVSSIFLFKLNVTSLWIFSIINAISTNLILIPHKSISFAVISATPNNREIRTEAMVVKSIFMNVGGLLSLLIFTLISSRYDLIPHFIFALGLIQIPIWIMLRKVNLQTI